MKTILITGGNGFLAKEFYEYFKERYTVILATRKDLDVTNKEMVDSYFANHNIDYVFHTAIKGGSRLRKDTYTDFLENLNMYQNLKSNSRNYSLLFNFGSGAEFDKEKNIMRCKEEDIFDISPTDYYGRSKNIISRDVKEVKNMINVRLFGCFGKNEKETRFIKSSINKCINDEDLFVDNLEMDFFSVEDLCILLEYLLLHDTGIKDINAVYPKKVSLEYIANYIKEITGSKSNIKINFNNNKNYSGSSKKIESLQIELCGLEKSIDKMYNEMYSKQTIFTYKE